MSRRKPESFEELIQPDQDITELVASLTIMEFHCPWCNYNLKMTVLEFRAHVREEKERRERIMVRQMSNTKMSGMK
jgi:hypothetical protein